MRAEQLVPDVKQAVFQVQDIGGGRQRQYRGIQQDEFDHLVRQSSLPSIDLAELAQQLLNAPAHEPVPARPIDTALVMVQFALAPAGKVIR